MDKNKEGRRRGFPPLELVEKAEERQRLRAEAYNISSNYNSFLLSGGKKAHYFLNRVFSLPFKILLSSQGHRQVCSLSFWR